MDNVLVTGATSYLGTELTRRLLADGVGVSIVARPTSDLSGLEALAGSERCRVFKGPATELSAWIGDAPPDTVFHLAGRYLPSPEHQDVAELIEANVLFGTQLLDALARAGGCKVVNFGTYAQFFDSDDYRPLNLYAATKQAFQDVVRYYIDATPITALTLALYQTYGPGDSRARLMVAIRDAQRDGAPLPLVDEDETTLDLVFADDVIEACFHAAKLLEETPETVSGKTFAVSSGARHTFSDVIALFEEIGGRPIKQDRGAYPPMARSIKDPWRGPGLPGWSPKVTLEEGIRRFIAAA